MSVLRLPAHTAPAHLTAPGELLLRCVSRLAALLPLQLPLLLQNVRQPLLLLLLLLKEPG